MKKYTIQTAKREFLTVEGDLMAVNPNGHLQISKDGKLIAFFRYFENVRVSDISE